jgi:hypothetical protein
VNVTDEDALAKGGYKPLSQRLTKAPRDEFAWEDVKSEGVHRSKPNLTVGVDRSGAGLPVEGSITFSLESSIQSGAVLHCNSSVHQKGLAHEKPLRDWGKANASAILKIAEMRERMDFS